VEIYHDTLVGVGEMSLKGLVHHATGIDPRAMRFFFMQNPMHGDDRTVSSYGVGHDAIVALRLATVSVPNLRPSQRANPYATPADRSLGRPERWLEDKAAGLKTRKESILSDEVTLVQKWMSLPATAHSSPLERAADIRQASELVYIKDFSQGSYEDGRGGGGARPWDGLSALRESIAKIPSLHERKAGAAKLVRTMKQSIRVMANEPVPTDDIFAEWQRVHLERRQRNGKPYRVEGVWNRVSPGARSVLPGGEGSKF
jgi:hypothetical protein